MPPCVLGFSSLFTLSSSFDPHAAAQALSLFSPFFHDIGNHQVLCVCQTNQPEPNPRSSVGKGGRERPLGMGLSIHGIRPSLCPPPPIPGALCSGLTEPPPPLEIAPPPPRQTIQPVSSDWSCWRSAVDPIGFASRKKEERGVVWAAREGRTHKGTLRREGRGERRDTVKSDCAHSSSSNEKETNGGGDPAHPIEMTS